MYSSEPPAPPPFSSGKEVSVRCGVEGKGVPVEFPSLIYVYLCSNESLGSPDNLLLAKIL